MSLFPAILTSTTELLWSKNFVVSMPSAQLSYCTEITQMSKEALINLKIMETTPFGCFAKKVQTLQLN